MSEPVRHYMYPWWFTYNDLLWERDDGHKMVTFTDSAKRVCDWMDDYYENDNTLWFWSRVLFLSFFGWFFSRNYPEVLILEYGADKPGDIKKLAHKFKPDIGVITAIGEMPVHVEFFDSPEAVIEEKELLVSALKPDGVLVYNQDDERAQEIAEDASLDSDPENGVLDSCEQE